MHRKISPSEIAVLECVLRVGATAPVPPEVREGICALTVSASCKCGCGTIWFGPKGDAATGEKIGWAVGGFGEKIVELIAWWNGRQLLGLEVVGPPGESLPAA